MAQYKAGIDDKIVVWKLDRIGRSLKHIIELSEFFDRLCNEVKEESDADENARNEKALQESEDVKNKSLSFMPEEMLHDYDWYCISNLYSIEGTINGLTISMNLFASDAHAFKR